MATATLARHPLGDKANDYPIGSGYRSASRPGHRGVDIPTPLGTPCVAAISGKVTIGTEIGGAGCWINITNGNVTVKYFHMSATYVQYGQWVEAGDLIGLTGGGLGGNSGDCAGATTGPHLHFEIWVNGVDTNPTEPLRQVLQNIIDIIDEQEDAMALNDDDRRWLHGVRDELGAHIVNVAAGERNHNSAMISQAVETMKAYIDHKFAEDLTEDTRLRDEMARLLRDETAKLEALQEQTLEKELQEIQDYLDQLVEEGNIGHSDGDAPPKATFG